jgi:hypothetical protein
MKLDYAAVHECIYANENLTKFYNWYIRHCVTMTNPYHNLRHTLGMIYHIINLFNRCQQGGHNYGFQLGNEDLYILILSALFHDFNHSAGRFDDATNVKIAKQGLEDCLKEVLEGEDVDFIINLCKENIDATQFPYVIDDADLTVHQRILRECDLLVSFYDDYLTQNVFGLMEEMKEKDVTKFFAGNMQFMMDSIKKMKLEYSREIVEENMNEFFKISDIYSKILMSWDKK